MEHDRGTNQLAEVVIGEAKYTTAPATFSDGVRELVEYMYFAKQADTYLFDAPLEAETLHGIICTDGVETKTQQVDHVHHWDTACLKQSFE